MRRADSFIRSPGVPIRARSYVRKASTIFLLRDDDEQQNKKSETPNYFS